VTLDPNNAASALKGSGSSYKLSAGGVIMMTFNTDKLTKDIEQVSFSVDGFGSLKIWLADKNVQSLIVVS
jgi:hypothetical protein